MSTRAKTEVEGEEPGGLDADAATPVTRPAAHSPGFEGSSGAGQAGPVTDAARLLPGVWVEVRPLDDILATLDERQSLYGLMFMPEMAAHCGGRYQVALRAERTCVHPPEFPFRQLSDTVTLEGVRCDGRDHGGCQLGCMLFWKASWLRPAGDDSARTDLEAPPPSGALRATRPDDPDRFLCQATELRAATAPGIAFWRPGQYVHLVRAGTFTIRELAAVFARIGGRKIRRTLRPTRPPAGARAAAMPPLGLQPGDAVEIRSADEIARTLDANGTHRGLAFGGDMHAQCGRRTKVLRRVDRIISEGTGELRTIHDTVILEDSVCDRYFGCARGMPFLWREVWLKRTDEHGASNGAGRRESRFLIAVRRRAALVMKRWIDVVVSGIAIVALAPVLLWISVAIAATQGLPVIFRHTRPGYRERPFTMVKFRTMRPPRTGEVWYLTDDDRVTRLGRFLRATSLDELPELWNVLRGEMSLVGPRPLLTEYLDTYTLDQHRRHDVRPGFTGWAAVHGRHVLGFEDRLALDVWYVDHWSLRLDVRILAMTVSQVLRRTGVSATQDLAAVGFPLPGVPRPGGPDDAP